MDLIIFFIFLSLVLIEPIKRIKMKRKIIAKSRKEIDPRISISIPLFIFALSELRGVLKNFNFLVESKHIIDWKHMFDYSYIMKMEAYFSEMKMYEEYQNISEYTSSMLLFIFWSIITVLFILYELQGKMICQEGICTNYGEYTWNKIESYTWIGSDIIANKEYFNLSFLCITSKKEQIFFNETFKFIRFEIKAHDREKVASFLREVLPQQENAL